MIIGIIHKGLCWLGFHKDVVFKWQLFEHLDSEGYKWNVRCLLCGREKQLGWYEYL